MKTKEEIKELIEFGREMNLESIEVDGMKLVLGSKPILRPNYVEEMKAEEMVKPISPFDELSEEEILYWATPYFDELQAKKEAQRNQKQQDDELKQELMRG